MVPFHFLLGFVILVSTFMVITSSNWIGMWLALELNSLSLLPFIKGKGAGKYLLAQGLGSAMIVASVGFGSDFFVLVGAALKAGVAPLHFWLPQVMSLVSWPCCLVLSTWQKVAPLSILLSTSNFGFLVFLSFFSATFGALGALKQTYLRKIIAYSSITHMAWVLGGATGGVMYSVIYFFLYTFVSFFLILKLSFSNLDGSISNDLSFVWLLYSMAGLPPLIGLYPKFWVLCSCSTVVVVPLVVSSVIMLYIYSSIAFSSVKLSRIKSFSFPMLFLLSFPWILI